MEPIVVSPPDAVRVVAVDDRAALLDLYRVMFHGTRFELVATAGDGRSGVEAAVEHAVDLVLMDLSMPEMDGLEALVELRKRRPEVRVVVVTGFGGDRLGNVARELGAADFVEKGTPPAQVLARLDEAMARPVPAFLEPDQALLERARRLV